MHNVGTSYYEDAFPLPGAPTRKPRRWGRNTGDEAAKSLAVEIPAASAEVQVPPPVNGNIADGDGGYVRGGTCAGRSKGKGRGMAGDLDDSSKLDGVTRDDRNGCERRNIRGDTSFPKAAGAGKGSSLTAAYFTAGARSAYQHRYLSDIKRLLDLPPNVRWVDSHCHLESILARTWRGGGKPAVTDNEPMVDLQGLVELWPPGLDGCVSNFTFIQPSKPGFPSEMKWLEANLCYFEPESPIADKLWFTIGLHPHDARNWDYRAEKILRRFARHPKCVGIGECGVDFFKHEEDEAEKKLQLNCFRRQVQLAVELGKAVVIHGRLVTKANETMFMEELKELLPREHCIHVHCYGDSLEHAYELCDYWPNLRIGFTGAITFRDQPGAAKAKSKGGRVEVKGEAHCRALVRGLPLERLLIETDGPYMCPHPFRGQTAHPGHVHRVAERIAEWQNKSLQEVLVATRKSTTVVYGI